MKKFLIFTILTLSISGCTFVGTNENIQKFESNSIDTSQGFYMIKPKNGFEQTYFTASIVESKTSAEDVKNVFYKKFFKTFGNLTISDDNVSLDRGLKNAKMKGEKYLITMDINEWKDVFYLHCAPVKQQGQMTTLHQSLDAVDVTIYVYDVNSQKLLNKQRIQNSGCPIKLLAVIPVGKNSPDSRFNSSLDKWFENLNKNM